MMKDYKKMMKLKNPLMNEWVGKKVFVLRDNSLDCGIFTDKNLGGYGKGIRGDFFCNDKEFDASLKTGDCLKRRVFTLDTLNELKEILLGGQLFTSDEYFKNFVKDLIEKTRKSYCSADPDLERKKGVYVEIEDLFKD